MIRKRSETDKLLDLEVPADIQDMEILLKDMGANIVLTGL